MMDNDDRRVVVLGAIRVVSLAALVLLGAAVAGAALRLFQIVSGI